MTKRRQNSLVRLQDNPSGSRPKRSDSKESNPQCLPERIERTRSQTLKLVSPIFCEKKVARSTEGHGGGNGNSCVSYSTFTFAIHVKCVPAFEIYPNMSYQSYYII